MDFKTIESLVKTELQKDYPHAVLDVVVRPIIISHVCATVTVPGQNGPIVLTQACTRAADCTTEESVKALMVRLKPAVKDELKLLSRSKTRRLPVVRKK